MLNELFEDDKVVLKLGGQRNQIGTFEACEDFEENPYADLQVKQSLNPYEDCMPSNNFQYRR